MSYLAFSENYVMVACTADLLPFTNICGAGRSKIRMEDEMKKETQGIHTCVITVTVFPVQCNKNLLFLNSKTVYLALIGHDNVGTHRLQFLWLICVQIIWMSRGFRSVFIRDVDCRRCCHIM